MSRARILGLSVLVTTALALAGCAADTRETDASAPAETTEAAATAAQPVTLTDGVVRATVKLADTPVRTMGAGDEDYGDLGGMEEMEHGSEHGH